METRLNHMKVGMGESESGDTTKQVSHCTPHIFIDSDTDVEIFSWQKPRALLNGFPLK